MNDKLNGASDAMALIGRILIAWLFVPEGWNKIVHFSSTVGYIAKMNVPLPEVCAAIAIVVELGLGLLILVGWQTRWAALGTAIYILVITPIFHAFWAVPEAQAQMQRLNFDKNLALAGGVLALAAYGAGRFSLDGRRTGRA